MNNYQSLLHAVHQHALSHPDKLCIAERETAFNYGEYWRMVLRIAAKLKGAGIKRGDRVVVKSADSFPLTACGLGIQLAGGVFVPVEKTISPPDLAQIVDATEARITISSEPAGDPCTVERLAINELLSEKAEDEESKAADHTFPEAEEIAEILYTTGTTGERKGVVLTHRNVVAVAENIMCGVEMKPDNIELLPVSITHSYGLRSYYASMLNGSSVVFLGGVAAMSSFFTEIERWGATSLALVPAVINMLLKLSGDRLASYADQLDYVQSGSSALTEEAKDALCRLLPRSRLYNFYGSTEAGRCCLIDYNKERGKVSCIGRPARNAYFKIVDENRKPLPPSEENTGYLACSGDMTMKEYWKDPHGTEQTLSDGWLYTKDLAYMDEEGYIYFAGRTGDIINSGGVKIIPTEIENVACSHPGVEECLCVPVEDEILGHVPHLCVVIKQGKTLTEKELLGFLAGRLEADKMPRAIRWVEAIPRTFNGKPDRRAFLNAFEQK